jgi:hypothetical protein
MYAFDGTLIKIQESLYIDSQYTRDYTHMGRMGRIAHAWLESVPVPCC